MSVAVADRPTIDGLDTRQIPALDLMVGDYLLLPEDVERPDLLVAPNDKTVLWKVDCWIEDNETSAKAELGGPEREKLVIDFEEKDEVLMIEPGQDHDTW